MSIIDICNSALAKNHHHDKIPIDADLSNPVGKAQTVCAEFIDQARRTALRLSNWTCIIKRERLYCDKWQAETSYEVSDHIVTDSAVFECVQAGTSGDTEPTWTDTGTVTDGTAEWSYLYGILVPIPASNLTQYQYAFPLPDDYINLVELQDSTGTPVDFEMERGIVYTNCPQPILRYVPDEKNDALWDPLLREVVITQLASMIAYPLTGSHENEVAFAQSAYALAQSAGKKTRREHRQGPAPGKQWMSDLFSDRYR